MTGEQTQSRLVVRGLTKHFGGTTALADVDFAVAAGEVHALLGANGAGKSTLIKILAGLHAADAGEVSLRGRPLGQALAARKIAFVHQGLGLIDSMSIAENMAMLCGYPRRRGLIDWRAVEAAAAGALQALGVALSPGTVVGLLSQAEKSVVAIARALTSELDILVLGEPTASLPEADVTHLFAAVRRLRARGVGVIYVTHRLDEVFRLADAVTVLRDGRNIATYRPVAALSSEQLVRDIVGRTPTPQQPAASAGAAHAMLDVAGLCVEASGPVSFHADAGEVVGLAGLRGQGHEVVGRALAGLVSPSAGTIQVGGQAMRFASPREAIAAGAGIDVFETEPPDPADPLFRLPNLLATPHAAAWTLEGMRNMGWTGARNPWAMISGQGTANMVNL